MRIPALFALTALMSVAVVLPTRAADLVVSAPSEVNSALEETMAQRGVAASNLLTLMLVRATFDLHEVDEVPALVLARMRGWGDAAPGPAERAELSRQLLAEASYYITGLSYLVQWGGAAFPRGKDSPRDVADTLVRLDALQRQVEAVLALDGEVAPLLNEVEAIRALTEGYVSPPEAFGTMAQHGRILDEVLAPPDRRVGS